MQKPIEKILLPFASYQANEGFNDDAEKAAVFCITELDRKKGGGFFRKQDSEKTVFISKVLYPFWIVSFGELTTLIDGMNIASHAITYPALSDFKAFTEKLRSQQMTRQIYTSFLIDNQNYFQNSSGELTLKIEGLINDYEFLKEFLEYTQQATTIDTPIVEAVFVTPALDQEGVSKMLQNIEKTRMRISEEVTDLNDIIKLLNKKNQEFQANLKKEIKAVEVEFNVKTQKVKAVLDNNVAKINKTYCDQVTQVSNTFEEKMAKLHKDFMKLEKEKEKLDLEIQHIEVEIKTSAINKDETTEQKLKLKRNRLRAKQPEIASNLKEMQKQINRAEEIQKNNMFLLKQGNDLKIKEAGKDLAEIEASRDAEIKVYRNEMERIEELASNIIKKVDELVKTREVILPEFDHLGIKQNKENNKLVYMPFYLLCYQSKSHKRYSYLAPSNVNDGSLSNKLKSFGKIKLKQLLQPRSKKIISRLNSFISLLDGNIVFCCEISEACMKANLLRMKKTREAVENGLNKLKEKGWLSSKELEQFNQEVAQDFSS